MLVGFLVAMLSVVIAGGDVRRLGELQFRAAPLVFVAIAVQILITTVIPGGNENVRELVHLGTYVAVFVFLALNHGLPGMRIIAVGALLNVAAIAANGGVMPADPGAVRRAGLEQEVGTFENSRPLEHPRLRYLGDYFAVPESWPASNVFSVGDVLIVLGAAVGMHRIGRSRIVPKRFLPVVRNAGSPTP